MLTRMLGYDSADAVIGISARDILYDPAHLQQIENDLAKDGSLIRRELQLKHKEGSGVLWHSTPVWYLILTSLLHGLMRLLKT